MYLAASVVLLSGLAGCGDGDEPQTDPTPSTSSPSETGSSPTDEPTEPTQPEVEPATGPRVVTERFSFRGPEGWVVTGDQLPFIELERDPGNKLRLAEPHGIISVTVLPSGRSFTLEQAARRADADGKRQPDIDLDGEPAYHFISSDLLESYESFGLWREPFESITIGFGTFGTTRAERQAMAASVLATWNWRS